MARVLNKTLLRRMRDTITDLDLRYAARGSESPLAGALAAWAAREFAADRLTLRQVDQIVRLLRQNR